MTNTQILDRFNALLPKQIRDLISAPSITRSKRELVIRMRYGEQTAQVSQVMGARTTLEEAVRAMAVDCMFGIAKAAGLDAQQLDLNS